MRRLNLNLCKSAAALGVLHGTRREPARSARPVRPCPAAGSSGNTAPPLLPGRAQPGGSPAWGEPGPGAGNKRRFPFLPLPPAAPGRVRPEKPPPLPRVWRHWPPPRCARPPQLPAEGRGPGCAGAARERSGPCRAVPRRPRASAAAPGRRGRENCVAPPRPPLPGGGSATSRAGAGRQAVGPRSAESRRVGGRRGSGRLRRGGRALLQAGEARSGLPSLPAACAEPSGPATWAAAPGLRPPLAGVPERCPGSRPGTPGRVSSGGAPGLGQDSVALLVIGVLNKIGCFRTAHFSVRLLLGSRVCVRAPACAQHRDTKGL